MSNLDGAAALLGLEPRKDITKDFQSASMGRNPDLLHSLPAKSLEELEQRPNYVDVCEQIEELSLEIKASPAGKEQEELRTQQNQLYYQRRRLRNIEVEKYKTKASLQYST